MFKHRKGVVCTKKRNRETDEKQVKLDLSREKKEEA